MNAGPHSGTQRVAEVHPHKLFAPPPYPDVIRREAILQRIFQNEAARVVVLQAPAGHGKSTSLQQIKATCEERGDLTGWLTFDEADNDARRLFTHIQALLASVHANAGAPADPTADLDDAGKRQRSDWVIDRLLKLGRPIALFLDDFQALDNQTILDFFRELCGRVPQNVRFFIGSRAIPEIGLPRLVVNHQALLLKPEELRFSPSEVKQFFDAARGVGITHDEMDIIYRRTEGWPAALQLFRLSLVSPAVRRSLEELTDSGPSELAEYLADNVLSLQPPGIQDFLLRTSLLTRLTAPLCDAVTGRRDSQEILLLLKQSGLFVRSLDSDTRWFEYHALFAKFLSNHLHSRSETAANEVHRRAARWHLDNGNYEETVHHAIACGKVSLAADTLDTWSSQLIAGAHLMTMERWCARIPFEEVARRPSLLIKLAWALVFLRRRDKLKPVLKLLQQRKPPYDVCRTTDPNIVLSMVAIAADNPAVAFRVVDRVPVRKQEVEGFAAFELSAAANLMGYRQLAFGDFEGARDLLGLARAHGDRGDASFSRGYTIGVTGLSLLAQGQLREALQRFKAGMAEQRMHVDRSLASAALACCYVWALYEANELDLAEALFGQHRDVISESALLDFLAVAYASMARVHDVRGHPDKAAEVLDEAEALGHSNDWKRYLGTLNWERVRRSLLAGDIERAEAIAAANPPAAPSAWLMFSEDLEGEGLGRIRLAVYSGDYGNAAGRLASEFARQKGRVVRQLKLHLLDAQLQYRKGARNNAQRSLRRALQLAAPGGFVRCFLDEGEFILKMLREEYQSLADNARRDGTAAPEKAFVEHLLQVSGTDLSHPAVKVETDSLGQLTEREKEILLFLAKGVSNLEIANRLFVSANTVKFHLKNIYSKLAVSNRLQAITAARQLGFVQ